MKFFDLRDDFFKTKPVSSQSLSSLISLLYVFSVLFIFITHNVWFSSFPTSLNESFQCFKLIESRKKTSKKNVKSCT